jgi:integrase/recombinase XerC/integrase/recombinase XerD
MLLVDAIQRFLIDNKLKGNTQKTLKNYESFLLYFVDFTGNIDVKELNLTLLKSYQLDLMDREFYTTSVRKDTCGTKLSKRTIKSYITHLRTFLNYLYCEGLIDTNLFAKFKPPKAPKSFKKILNDSQIMKIFDSYPNDFYGWRNKCVIACMIDSGLRVSETSMLNITDVDFFQNAIKVNGGKGEKDRIVPLGEYTKDLLLKYLREYRNSMDADNEYLFITDEGVRLSSNAIRNCIYRLKKKFGFEKLHPHLFRHTFATKYLINGGDIFSLQLILGHSDLDMVKKYSHVANSYMLSKHRRFSPLDVMNNQKPVETQKIK